MESQQDEQTELPEADRTVMRRSLYAFMTTEATVIVLSAVLLFGLLIPLLIQLKNGSYHQRSTVGRQRRKREPPYSSYNLYLVYLALVDLAYFLPLFTAEMMNVHQRFNPRFYSLAVFTVFDPPPPFSLYGIYGLPPAINHIGLIPYMVANMWLNAVIAYEVFILLQATHHAQRIKQPSLTRVNLQVGGVIFGSILLGIFNYYYMTFGWFGLNIYYWFVIIPTVIPIVYVLGVSILVKHRGYIPAANGSTPRDRAVRGLAFYFFRVTLVFVVVWLPYGMAMGFVTGGLSYSEEDLTAKAKQARFVAIAMVSFTISSILMTAQPIVTFCMVLTKPDVKRYIKDLVTLQYLFGDCRNKHAKKEPERAKEKRDSTVTTTGQRSDRSNRVSILGYNFSNVDSGSGGDSSGEGDNDFSGDEKSNDQETGIRQYEPRRLRGGAVTVLATGETVAVGAQSANTTASAATRYNFPTECGDAGIDMDIADNV